MVVSIVTDVDLHILQIRLLLSVTQVIPGPTVFEVVYYENSVLEEALSEVNDDLHHVAICSNAILVCDIARIIRCIRPTRSCRTGIPHVCCATTLEIRDKIRSLVI